MYRWVPLKIPERKDKRGLSVALNGAAADGKHIVAYFTPQRGWWAYVTDDTELPDDKPRLHSMMDTGGALRSVTTDVILRTADAIREGFPDET
jgi:hypothetical protein